MLARSFGTAKIGGGGSGGSGSGSGSGSSSGSSSSSSIFVDEHDSLITLVLINLIQICMYNKVNHRKAGSLSLL